MAEILIVVMLLLTVAGLMSGFPVAFTLSGVALLVGLVANMMGYFDLSYVGFLPQRIFGNAMWNEVLLAVPLFVFMGVTLERSRVAEELLDTMGKLFGSLRGGLGISVFVVGALLAASTGIVGATVVTMGLLSLPTMLRRGYAPELTTGAISASGTLGQIIPPSIILVILGDQISNAYVEAQRSIGNFAPEPVSVGDLFAGALIPGLMLVGLYILYMVIVSIVRPQDAPAIPKEDIHMDGGTPFWIQVAHALLPPVLLIIAVLGSILAGIATPTEAASVGATGALLLGALRISDKPGWPIYLAFLGTVIMLVLQSFLDLRVTRNEIGTADQIGIYIAYVCVFMVVYGVGVALVRVYSEGVLINVMQNTMKISAMVFVILIGAAVFSLVFRGLGGEDMIHHALSNLPGGLAGALIVVMILIFLLGFFLDFIEISFIIVPIVAPVLFVLGADPVWLGILIALNLQTSFLTPPFGFALFYLRGVAPKEVTTPQIYRGVIPFVGIQIFAILLLAFWPELATWLPDVIFG